MLSVHTSPLDPPGAGDAGGMNVYVLELSRGLAARGIAVEVFTRATASELPALVELEPGVLVHHVPAGPYDELTKEDLPAQLCAFSRAVLSTEAGHPPGHYDVVHAHYWLSGQVGALARDRWGVPLVQSMHTMAKVKNAALAAGDQPEPRARVIGEQQVVEAADVLVANTHAERRQLIEHYGAAPDRVEVVNPGVDLDVFAPRDPAASRRELGLPERGHVVVFAGRLQPLKGADVLLEAIAELVGGDPSLQPADALVVPVIGGSSGTGFDHGEELLMLARRLGLEHVVRFVPAMPQAELARWYDAASVVCVPSHNESFGLVAVEAQACGTPVVAAAVGGLTTAVEHEGGGLLVHGWDPRAYAGAVGRLLRNDGERAAMAVAARAHASRFGWDETARGVAQVYDAAVAATWEAREPTRTWA
ncbi:MAG: D-inositol-3-phosphate glycosyltransferase [Nocardioidaceae bacterium]|nr:D-inositol-3-phosphate glycosyltransferase [Nocardioidaceae bacterium]